MECDAGDVAGQNCTSQKLLLFQKNTMSETRILNPEDDRTQYTEMRLSAHDDEELFVRRYVPAEGESAQTLLMVHGVNEHGGRYDHVARSFVERGWNVIIGDHRGHGLSSGVPVHVDSFHEYVHDLEVIRSHFGLVPHRTALLGHSMGGLIVTRYAQSLPENLGALVLISPLLGLNVTIPKSTIALGKLLSYVKPKYRFPSQVDPADTTRSRDVLLHREEDPLFHRSVTASWFFAMQAALQTAWKEAGVVDVPLLLLQAGEDRIVCPDAAESWLETVGVSDKTFRLLPEHLHELLNEPTWRETTHDIADWLDERLRGDDQESDAELTNEVSLI